MDRQTHFHKMFISNGNLHFFASGKNVKKNFFFEVGGVRPS